MNQAQRSFLIKKIQDTNKVIIDAYRNAMPERPNLSNYLLNAVMSGTFQIKTTEEIKDAIRKKALNSTRSNWMAGKHAFNSTSETEITIACGDIFIIPEEYRLLENEYQAKVKALNDKIGERQQQMETLIFRIQLASDKVLQQLISQVDDMGNLSLFDEKLKLLTQ